MEKTSFYEIYKLPKLTLITDNKLHAIKNKLNKKKMKKKSLKHL